jgi:uncharacterized membrane protein
MIARTLNWLLNHEAFACALIIGILLGLSIAFSLWMRCQAIRDDEHSSHRFIG